MDCLVSIDGTWQKRGHQSLLGAVYVIPFLCTSMPVLANFQIWMLHSEDINIFIRSLHLNLSYGSA